MSKSKSNDNCEPLDICDFYCKHKGAVVRIYGTYTLTNTGYTEPGTLPEVLDYNVLVGNGFFLGKSHKIVCPARLVLIPPTQLVNRVRFPYVSTTSEPVDYVPNQTVKVSQILVDIFHLNGHHKSYTYDAELQFVDGATDIAVIKINPKSAWNAKNPCIEECHPYLKWGNSCDIKCQEKVYLMGDLFNFNVDNTGSAIALTAVETTSGCTFPVSNGEYQLKSARVLDKSYADHRGLALQELLLLDPYTTVSAVGVPILSRSGCVLGMQTISATSSNYRNENNKTNLLAGPSQNFIKYMIKCWKKGEDSKYGLSLRPNSDLLGGYYTFNKGYLGIAGRPVVGLDFATQMSTPFEVAQPVDSATFLPQFGDQRKRIVGYRVMGIATTTNSAPSFPIVPGSSSPSGTGGFASLPNSPLADVLSIGDIIVRLDCKELGALSKQIVPAYVTFNQIEGESVEVKYLKQSEFFAEEHTVKVKLEAYPDLLNYPYYAASANNTGYVLPAF